uniref:Uncharacterized protein n=1 Tax=Arundo donax TaxID=35708 RepID=A0A0A9CUR6_ARUDO
MCLQTQSDIFLYASIVNPYHFQLMRKLGGRRFVIVGVPPLGVYLLSELC